MIRHEVHLQTIGSEGAIYRGLMQAATSANFDCLIAAVAYATESGCQLVNEAFAQRINRWKRMEKNWLISIDYGLTEPSALEFLAALPNSRVFIPNAENALRAHLRPQTGFHKKMYVFDGGGPQEALSIFSGSANLTFSGLYLNDEQAVGLIWAAPFTKAERASLKRAREETESLSQLETRASPLTPSLLRRYRDARKSQPQPSPDDSEIVIRITQRNQVLPLSKAAQLATATCFWVSVNYVVGNLGYGLPGNQIDLPRGTRVFFGFKGSTVPRNTHLGSVSIEYAGHRSVCNMRFGNNQMDKLNLPIPGNPGPPTYQNRTLLFRRNPDNSFTLIVGSTTEVASWRDRSGRQASLFRMQGGREFGVFS